MNKIKAKAYISLILIICIGAISVSILYINLMNQQNLKLAENYTDDKQAQYISESYLRSFYKKISNYDFKNSDYSKTIEKIAKKTNAENLFPEYEHSHRINFSESEENFGEINLISKIEYQKIKVSMRGKIQIFNSILKKKASILNESRFSKNDAKDFENLKNKYFKNEKYLKNPKYELISIDSPSQIYKKDAFNILQNENLSGGTIINSPRHYEILSNLILGDDDNSGVINLDGTFILKSDLVLKSDVILNGILIIDSGNIIDNDFSFRVNGIAIIMNENSSDKFESKYTEKFINKYIADFPWAYQINLESITLIY